MGRARTVGRLRRGGRKAPAAFATLAAAVALTGAGTASAATPVLTNPGFESGDFTGWTLFIPPGGGTTNVSSYVSDLNQTYTAVQGTRFALIKTNGPGSYATVSQTFTAAAGDTLSGCAFFDAQDYPPYNDNGQVEILQGGTPIATVYNEGVNSLGSYGDGPWRAWSFTAPAAGTYTVRARIANALDSILDSKMGFDVGGAACTGGYSGGDFFAPTITVPPNITTQATGPSGAPVSYTVTVTDNLDPNPSLSCNPYPVVATNVVFPVGTTTVTCTAKDASNNSASKSFTITVTPPANLPPTASAGGPYSVNEGGSTGVGATGSDPEGGALVYAWDLDDNGTFETPGQNVTFSAAGLDGPSTRTIKVRATDVGGLTHVASGTVNVLNVAPTANLNAPASVPEGTTILLGLFGQSDVSPADVAAGFTYAFDCGSGYGPFSSTPNRSCPTDDNGSRSVKGMIRDKDGGTSEYTSTVTVTNVNPTADFAASSPVSEGSSIAVSLANAADPSAADTAAGFSYAFDCGNGGGYGPFGTASTASCPALDNPGQLVKGKLRDKDGGVSEYTASVGIENVAPTVGAIAASTLDPVAVGTPVTLSASFTDPGTLDTHTASFAWGDGSSAGTVSESNGSGSVQGSHSYAAAGVYTVTLTVTDKDGGSGESTYQYVVVYDPSAGFVTGGGWINSPAGAYVADPSLTGKASFGFNAKYHPGKTTPDGQTQFQFKAGGLNFHSASYDWLVVSGHKAQYKGTGTINGSGSYSFTLTLTDGQRPGGGGVDKFRIRIRDASNSVVYDNRIGEPEDLTADPQAIAGGSIVIHGK